MAARELPTEPPMLPAAYRLGPVAVRVECDESVASYLDQFYEREHQPAEDAWTFRCGGAPAPGLAVKRNPFGVGVQVDAERRAVHLRAERPEDLRITLRKLIRAVFLQHCEAKGFTLLHAAAVYDDRTLLVLVGDRGAGKTTLALDAALRHGFTLLSNDHLVVYREGERLVLTSVPTVVSVKMGTALSLRGVLPPHPGLEGIEAADLGALGSPRLRRNRRSLYFSFGELGQPFLPRLELGPGTPPRARWIVFPRFGGSAGEPAPYRTPISAATAVQRFHREEWVYGDDDGPEYFPAPRRDAVQFVADSRVLCRALVQGAPTLRWRHAGDVAPLLDRIRAGRPE
jgi:hypothetical protein